MLLQCSNLHVIIIINNLKLKGVIDLFITGDKIVHPLYGAGIIEDVQEKLVDGQLNSYYTMNIAVCNLRIVVSSKKAGELGLRYVYESDRVLDVINSYTEIYPVNVPENWNQRYKNNMEKIKSGDLLEVLSVYRNLIFREKERGLSSAEKKLLTTVKQIVLSEIILTQEIEKIDAEEMLADSLNSCYNY